MNSTPSNPNARGDELSSARLDDGLNSLDVVGDETPIDPATSRRAADIQLIHSLLVHLNEDKQVKEVRVAQLMERLIAEEQTSAEAAAHRRRWLFPVRRTGVRWAAAASLALVIALWTVFLSSGTASAEAVLDRVIAATSEQVDRTYEITAEFDEDFISEHFGDRFGPPEGRDRGTDFGPDDRPPHPLRPPPGEEPFGKGPPPKGRGEPLPPDGRRPRDPEKGRPLRDFENGRPGERPDERPQDRPRFQDGPGWMHPDDHRPPRRPEGPPPRFHGPPLPLNGATLFVRGGDQFVLRRPLPDGESFIIGSNGQQTWFVPPRGPVKVSDNPKDFRGPLPEVEATIPFINIKADIEPLRAHYDLKVLDPAGLSDDDPVKWYRLEGRRRASAPPGPQVVRIWSDPDTGVVRRLECENMPMPRRPGEPRPPKGPTVKVTVNLVDQSPLDESWFDHAAHHESDREVRPLER